MSRLTDWFGNSRSTQSSAPRRWAVFDLETSGLDTARDDMLSVGAVAIVDGVVQPNDAFEAVVWQTRTSSHENIAIHGITTTAQRSGAPLHEVLRSFDAWRANAPLVGWHVAFDLAFLTRAHAQHGLEKPSAETLCVAQLSRVLLGKASGDLEEVAARFAITCDQRHHASADAWMTALVLSALISKARRDGIVNYHALRSLAKQSKWL